MRTLAYVGLVSLLAALASPPAWAKDADIGRLFLTPQERRAIDAQRSNSVAARDSLSLDGVVRSSSGHVTQWVNGEAMAVQKSQLQGARVPVEVAPGERVEMAPGQFFELDTRTVKERYRQAAP